MDPNAFFASLQQHGGQVTPAQIQQFQLFQQQQQQQAQQQQPPPQNLDTPSTSNFQSGQNTNGASATNSNSDVQGGTATFQGVSPPVATQQVASPPIGTSLPNTNGVAATNNAFQAFQQQLAALSAYQQQQNTVQSTIDNNGVQNQQQGATDNAQAQQQLRAWNPQMLQQQQQFNGANPFMATPGLVVPNTMNMQQLQQQFLAQQFLSQQLAAAGQNPATAGNFSQILTSLLAQSGAAAAAMQPNQMFQQPSMAGFPFVTAPVAPQQQQLMASAITNNAKASMHDGLKVSGEVEWTKPFAAKVKKESPFPLKLYQILGNPECQECITWNPHGRSWRILKPPLFEHVVIPLYFRHAKYASFMRQVNGWGFKRVVTGSDHNSYYHELFVRDNPQLCLQMKRIKRSDTDDAKANKDDDANDDNEENREEKLTGNGDTNAVNVSSMTSTQPTITSLSSPSPEDLLKFAGMAGMLNAGTMVGQQPNFMLNNMLPATALLGNPNAAMMNGGMNPMNFGGGIPGMPMAPNFTATATPPVAGLASVQQFQLPPQQQQQQSQSSAHAAAMLNVTTGTLQQQPSPAGNISNINNNMMGSMANVDSATLAKIQEIIASGGAETLLQQLQQHGQQMSGGFGATNATATTASNTSTNGMNTTAISSTSMEPTLNSNITNDGEVAIKTENEDPAENEDDDEEEDDDDDEEDVDDDDDDDEE